ncbi:MAG: cutinase family protein [Gordonia sp. (in: high G+C Gram-positive bacteria)]|uniref:cutinase family protein n=1 Tax=Gordonia sp. (in: high G+C Gram-positive bacteria) TaxID=84139 RepID=UPI0039E2D926
MRLRSAFALAAVAVGSLSATTVAAPHADAAAGCANVTVVFARGTQETAPPVGVTGLAFGQELRSRLPGKNVRISAVNYPASGDFNDRPAFVRNLVRGIKDTQAQVRGIAARCPKTRIVVGGYSQGAVVATYAVADSIAIPAKYMKYSAQAPKPMPADVARHVSAVVLFAPASSHWIRQVGAPPMHVGAAYRGKTRSYCAPGDNVCDGSPVGAPQAVHLTYPVNGATAQAADFAARRSR